LNDTVFQLTNNQGVIVEFISLGGRIIAVKLPTKGEPVDIVVGYDTAKASAQGDVYMGAICGRYANRIAHGKFRLDNQVIQLAQNNGGNHLHGGDTGFHTKYWEVSPITKPGYASAFQLTLISPDGDENYPGTLQIQVIYALNDSNELLIEYQATSDKKTIINLTSHPYFNLKGIGGINILDHQLQINAHAFTPIDKGFIPTGEIRSVKNSDMDFNQTTFLSQRLQSKEEQIHMLGGLDHNFVLNKTEGKLSFAARVSEPVSGRSVEVYTTQPGLQVYTALHFDGSEIGKGGHPIGRFSGIALEAQNFPDAPNHANFPDAVLNVGDIYRQTTLYRFGL